jgi:hypothetical protein
MQEMQESLRIWDSREKWENTQERQEMRDFLHIEGCKSRL